MEGAEADGVVLAEDVERLHGVERPRLHLGDEERAAGTLVAARPLDEVGEVDVGREEVYLRRGRAPNVYEVRQGAGARVLTRQVARTDEGRVDEHRDVQLGLAPLGHAVRVAREVPGHENLVRRRPAPEDLLPTAARLPPRRGPGRAKLWRQSLLILLKVGHQLLRHGAVEELLGDGAAVARVWDHPDLV